MATSALWLALVLGSSAVAGRPADCTKARSQAERLVCADPALMAADRQVAELYARALAEGPYAEPLRAEQRAWLADRDRCPDAPCLARAYQGRAAVLRRVLAASASRGILVACEAEQVGIDATPLGGERPPSFDVVKAEPGESRFFLSVAAGRADCRLADGTEVRLKTATGPPGEHECGAAPSVFLTLWYDRKRVASDWLIAAPCGAFVMEKVRLDAAGLSWCRIDTRTPGPPACDARAAATWPTQPDEQEYPSRPGARP